MVNLVTCFFLSLFGVVRRNSKTIFLLLLVFLYVLASNDLTSPDRGAYRIYYASLNKPSLKNNLEIGFQVLIWISKSLGITYGGFFYLYYGICFGLLLYILIKVSFNPVMVLSLYMFYPYVVDVDQMRSMLGYFIVLFGVTVFLLKEELNRKDTILYASFCIIAALFQQSCIVFLIFLFCRNNKEQVLRYSLIASGILILGRSLVVRFISIIGVLNINRVERYFSQAKGKSTWYIYVLFYIVLILFSLFYLKRSVEKEGEMKLNMPTVTIANLNILSLPLVGLIFINPHFERLARPIVLMDYIMLTNMIKPKITRYYEIVIICFLYIFSIGRFLTYFYGAGMESYIKPIFFEGFSFFDNASIH